MKKSMYKDPVIVALGVTLLAFMFVPVNYRDSAFSVFGQHYDFVGGLFDLRVDWALLAFELIAIWIGCFVCRRVIELKHSD